MTPRLGAVQLPVVLTSLGEMHMNRLSSIWTLTTDPSGISLKSTVLRPMGLLNFYRAQVMGYLLEHGGPP